MVTAYSKKDLWARQYTNVVFTCGINVKNNFFIYYFEKIILKFR